MLRVRFILHSALACLVLLANACDGLEHAQQADAGAQGDAGRPPLSGFQHLVRAKLGAQFGGMWIDVPTQRTKIGVVGISAKTNALVREAAEADGVATSRYDCVSVPHSFAELTREDTWLSNEIDAANVGAEVTFYSGITMNVNMSALVLDLGVPTAGMTNAQKALIPRVKAHLGDMLRIEYWAGHADPR